MEARKRSHWARITGLKRASLRAHRSILLPCPHRRRPSSLRWQRAGLGPRRRRRHGAALRAPEDGATADLHKSSAEGLHNQRPESFPGRRRWLLHFGPRGRRSRTSWERPSCLRSLRSEPKRAHRDSKKQIPFLPLDYTAVLQAKVEYRGPAPAEECVQLDRKQHGFSHRIAWATPSTFGSPRCLKAEELERLQRADPLFARPGPAP